MSTPDPPHTIDRAWPSATWYATNDRGAGEVKVVRFRRDTDGVELVGRRVLNLTDAEALAHAILAAVAWDVDAQLGRQLEEGR